MYFSAFVGGAFVFFFMAFVVFLPMLVFAPAKFALSFTFGSLCTMAAMNMLSGWKAGLDHMFSAERRLFTAVYLGSMSATLYAALYMHSYLLSLGFSVVQVSLQSVQAKTCCPDQTCCQPVLHQHPFAVRTADNSRAHHASTRTSYRDIVDC